MRILIVLQLPSKKLFRKREGSTCNFFGLFVGSLASLSSSSTTLDTSSANFLAFAAIAGLSPAKEAS